MGAKDMLLAAAVAGMLLIGSNSAFPQDWVLTSAPSTNWVSVASSADGSRLVAASAGIGDSGGPIWVSTNSGTAWAPTSAPLTNWSSIASSSDGTTLLAANSFGPVWISTNSGGTWRPADVFPPSLPNGRWNAAAASADGTKLVVAGGVGVYGTVCASTNSGATWTIINTSGGYWTCLVSSADGFRLFAGSVGFHCCQGVWFSTNSGATWVGAGAPITAPYWLACSADGGKIADFGAGAWLSADGGSGWTSTSVNGGPVGCSADGIKLVTVGPSGVFTSPNFGTTWISNNAPSLNWSAVASSADGNKLVAAVNGGGIYTSQTTPKAMLGLTTSDSGFLISWVVPSMPFVLQECADLTTTNWIDVNATPTLNFTNLHHEVSVPASKANRFYRLRSL